MGMFDFLKKNKTETTLPEAPANTLLAVQNGTIVPVESLPDPVFAEKVLGDGYAIDPTDGKVLSPVSGTIIDIQDILQSLRCNQNTKYDSYHIAMWWKYCIFLLLSQQCPLPDTHPHLQISALTALHFSLNPCHNYIYKIILLHLT